MSGCNGNCLQGRRCDCGPAPVDDINVLLTHFLAWLIPVLCFGILVYMAYDFAKS